MKLQSITLAVLLAAAGPLVAQTASTDEQIPEAQMTRADRFEKLDTNKDGTLSREEYLASEWSKQNPDRAPKVFEYRDDDRDGKLTLAEFEK